MTAFIKTLLINPLPFTAVWKCKLPVTEIPCLRALCFVTLELQVLTRELQHSHIWHKIPSSTDRLWSHLFIKLGKVHTPLTTQLLPVNYKSVHSTEKSFMLATLLSETDRAINIKWLSKYFPQLKGVPSLQVQLITRLL